MVSFGWVRFGLVGFGLVLVGQSLAWFVIPEDKLLEQAGERTPQQDSPIVPGTFLHLFQVVLFFRVSWLVGFGWLVWFGLVEFSLVEFGLVEFGLVEFGLAGWLVWGRFLGTDAMRKSPRGSADLRAEAHPLAFARANVPGDSDSRPSSALSQRKAMPGPLPLKGSGSKPFWDPILG